MLRAAGSDDSLIVYWSSIPFPYDRAAEVSSFVLQWSTSQEFSADSTSEVTLDFVQSTTFRYNTETEFSYHSYNLTSLVAGTPYYVRVCGVNTMGRGDFANAVFTQDEVYEIVPRAKANVIPYTSVSLNTIPI